MNDLQWMKANGEIGEYKGPTIALGKGIPRKMGEHGFRRAMFDLALGYASGFPVRDIIPFVMRSLFPQGVREAALVEEPDGPPVIGAAWIECPVCGEFMPASVTAEIEDDDYAHVGEARLTCTPDMTDIHAHMWQHEGENT